jgi:hypothetical protein
MIIIGGIMSSLGALLPLHLLPNSWEFKKKKVLIENVAPFMWCVW